MSPGGPRSDGSEALPLIETRAERCPAPQSRVPALRARSVPEVLAVAVEAGAPAHDRLVHESVGAEGR